MVELRIFYDGGCPLCLSEMRHLHRLDQHHSIKFVDINDPDFQDHYPNIDKPSANRILHGQLANGKIILGLDVTHRAWTLVGRGKWTAVLRWPVIRPLADRIYLLFARHRNLLSRWITGQPRCQSCNLERDK